MTTTLRIATCRASKTMFAAALVLAVGSAMPAFAQVDDGRANSGVRNQFPSIAAPTEIANAGQATPAPAANDTPRLQFTVPTEVAETAPSNPGASQGPQRQQLPPPPRIQFQTPTEVVSAPTPPRTQVQAPAQVGAAAPAPAIAAASAISSLAQAAPRRQEIVSVPAPVVAPAATAQIDGAAELYSSLVERGYQVEVLGRDHRGRYSFAVRMAGGNRAVAILVEAATGNIVAHRAIAHIANDYASTAPAYVQHREYAAPERCSPSRAYSARY